MLYNGTEVGSGGESRKTSGVIQHSLRAGQGNAAQTVKRYRLEADQDTSQLGWEAVARDSATQGAKSQLGCEPNIADVVVLLVKLWRGARTGERELSPCIWRVMIKGIA
jgi:hypothetical protein